MFRTIVLAFAILLIAISLATGAFASRLILIPTGTTLTTGGISLEYAANTDLDDAKIYWVNLGVSRFEVEGARFDGFGVDDADVFSAQVSVLPETSFTPAVAIGIRDIADESDNKGMPYDGRSFYLAATKAIPVTGGVPFLLEDVKLHGGIGTGGRLSGVFFGAQGRLPMGIRLGVEYDTEDFNYEVAYNVVPMVKVQLSSIADDIYYGATFSTAF